MQDIEIGEDEMNEPADFFIQAIHEIKLDNLHSDFLSQI